VSKYITNLQVGDRCRIEPGGAIHTVVKRTPCALYIRGGEDREVTLVDPETGESKTFVAQGSKTLAYAPNGFFYPA
jgi:hypothetical protein